MLNPYRYLMETIGHAVATLQYLNTFAWILALGGAARD
ncbi:hypothetical protein EYZ11_008274 [Aspergillus tanneri]|uniref:Uncharacterized protein n=1 Tax=Aspergillus tanneri TaxID=1220188 RepID=A0A4S3JD29_9EURO|nr:hypothetical protein EYZ11_008274 [Aspergillus tanneri]